jgi:hypothetical protein
MLHNQCVTVALNIVVCQYDKEYVKLYRVSQSQHIPSQGSCRERYQESRKNKIKIQGGSLQRYMGLKVQTFHHVFLK